ncbi:MAG: tRNA preQ1(34) S-adenosylmethionine ribosyltransferase-isomerase QueA [Planctomycetes bacterium]|nr:tRNA preQ1(34) S-adenosylmethionine ribosyltransferase-isomerase QueA [Planctomycetota bacterium]MBI3834887.1 tRNA preQ1(34) S-adenosylmethionine ribosyltransferase-isomerase QueA [Planctomycetota bacterium]
MEQLDYDLPRELVAQSPPARREDARMLVLDRADKSISDRSIRDLPEFLRPGDLAVVNDTKVMPARFAAWRETGGRVSGLFVREESAGLWQVLLEGSRRLRPGEVIEVRPEVEPPMASLRSAVSINCFAMTLESYCGDGLWRVRVPADCSAEELLNRVGRTPLPPYIRRENNAEFDARSDAARYQTVYASKPGAVAAPTAGLHLTDEIIEKIRSRGVNISSVTLHVGLGTFRPIAVENLAAHVMHSEDFEVPASTLKAIRECRPRGGRILVVGTTSVRVLETISSLPNGDVNSLDKLIDSGEKLTGSTSILIYPPYQFQSVDILLTNFHLPRSTLLALVMAFVGVEFTRRAYVHAIAERYRFYSYGDSMLIL